MTVLRIALFFLVMVILAVASDYQRSGAGGPFVALFYLLAIGVVIVMLLPTSVLRGGRKDG